MTEPSLNSTCLPGLLPCVRNFLLSLLLFFPPYLNASNLTTVTLHLLLPVLSISMKNSHSNPPLCSQIKGVGIQRCHSQQRVSVHSQESDTVSLFVFCFFVCFSFLERNMK